MQIQTLSSATTLVSGASTTDAPVARNQYAASAGQAVEAVRVSADAVQAVRASIDPEDVKNAVENLNKTSAVFNNSLQFSIDDSTKLTVVKLIDKESEEVVRQIPTEEVLAIAKAIDKLQGLLIKEKA
ncbi:flagellar protein FlaG [Chitinimonas viridis]|uniref:Flagellar protein FlaG n=1 Tax=Chitinimonas viridis TaxID=664880 RepID=A0ABT8B5G3_9NEIS|nr:flagellar protein FlaG [Chitinimonas viridis]MDN3577477.1 flagellar protein FlaG [Chitinimonas viridis]